MHRARRAALPAVFLVLAFGSAVIAGGGGGNRPATATVAAPTWPVATLLLSEVETGAASASDEFVELTNAGAGPVDLAGLEIAYVTSSGATVTRKASWAGPLLLEPGRHLLLANSLGTFVSLADATYSGGLAATGGAVVLRPIGGAPIDALAWGDATNGFVEGSAAPAPAAGSSLERRPGGVAGNGSDTNDNAADWFVQPSPSPQNVAAAPVPAPSATPGPTASPIPSAPPSTMPSPSASPSSTPSPSPSPSASVVPTPSPTASPSPSATPSPSASPIPTASPTPVPTATQTPTPPPSATPSASASVVPDPSPTPPQSIAIADARGLPNGSTVTVAGTLTTSLATLEGARTGFVQDESAGIAIYLDQAATAPWPAGTTILVRGILDDRFAQRTLRVALTDVLATGVGALPEPWITASGLANEDLEGSRLTVSGMTIGSPDALADGTGLTIDDGTGELRLVVSPAALGGAAVPAGTWVTATGPLGQRDSSGTGLAGYRLLATEPGEFVMAEPSPSPSPSPTPDPGATPSPGASAPPTPSPSPTASPTPSAPSVSSIYDARQLPIGSRVTVAGVVTAEAGRLGTPPLLAIQDASAGIVVRPPDGAAAPPRGRRIEVTGPLADPYGQLEIRPAVAGVRWLDTASLPTAAAIDGGQVSEDTEGLLVSIQGVALSGPQKATSGDLSFDVSASDGTKVRIMTDASSRIPATAISKGATYRLAGIAGQRATRKGVLDGYRIWLRDVADLRLLAPAPRASPGSSASPGTQPGSVPLTSVARALVAVNRTVRIQAVVTADASLLDASGRRIVVEDASAAVEVYLPTDASSFAVGTRVEVVGEMTRAYGAPRLKATDVRASGHGARNPVDLRAAPSAAYEWRLVRVSGTIQDIHKLGERWRAELQAGPIRIPISGLEGARIPSTMLVEGARATIIGIVRRPYPTATDRRFAIVPRSPKDVAIGPASGTGGVAGGGTVGPGPAGPVDAAGAIDVDMAALGDHVGQAVRVGGLVTEVHADGATLDDGTAAGRIVLIDGAADYLPLLEIGDPINVTGTVERRGAALAVVVRDAGAISRAGDPGALPADETAAPSPAAAPEAAGRSLASSGGFGLDAPGAAGVASLVLISLASLGVTLVRRRNMRRRLLATVTERLSTLGPAPAADGPGSR